jgi:hypothetical protein
LLADLPEKAHRSAEEEERKRERKKERDDGVLGLVRTRSGFWGVF